MVEAKQHTSRRLISKEIEKDQNKFVVKQYKQNQAAGDQLILVIELELSSFNKSMSSIGIKLMETSFVPHFQFIYRAASKIILC